MFHLYKKATNEKDAQHKMDPQIMFNLGIHFKGPFLLESCSINPGL